jgi:hypothetical protein
VCTPVLENIVVAWNQSHPENKIALMRTGAESQYRSYLIRSVDKVMMRFCKSGEQLCWLRPEILRAMPEEIANEATTLTHRPFGPQGNFTWLDTTNILDTMKQYEVVYPDFVYMCTAPRDFQNLLCVNKRVVGIPKSYILDQLRSGKRSFGAVFNTDPHNLPGKHWVGFFASAKTGQICYFDSVADQPLKEFSDLMGIFKEAFEEFGIRRTQYKINKNKMQFGDSECGVYSMTFNTRMLDIDDFDRVTSAKILDNDINKCRSVLMNKPSAKGASRRA